MNPKFGSLYPGLVTPREQLSSFFRENPTDQTFSSSYRELRYICVRYIGDYVTVARVDSDVITSFWKFDCCV